MKRSLEIPVADGRTDGRTEGTKFIGPQSALPGVQRVYKTYLYIIENSMLF